MRTFTRSMIILIACLLTTMTAEAQHDKYFFTTLAGRAVISRTSGSTWLALQKAQPVELKPGDMVNVEGDGRGELRFPDGTTARMKNNAMVKIMRYGIDQKLGYVWLNVRRSSDIFKVATPLGSCSVLGTSFDVEVDRFGKTKVKVFSGLVAVRAADDARSRQLVLQPGMRTTLADKTRVADKPEKFQHTTLEAQMISEWEPRNFADQASLPALQPAMEAELPPALQPAAPAQPARPVQRTRPLPARAPAATQPIIPPPQGPITGGSVQIDSTLPPIRPELPADISLPSAGEVISGQKTGSGAENDGIIIIARQRSEFLEMLRQQRIARDAVIGGSFSESERSRMIEDGHGQELGQEARRPGSFADSSVEREFWLLRNRMLRVQSEIRQKDLEIGALIRQGFSTPAHQRKISTAQSQLRELYIEQNVLTDRLRDVQTKKR